VAKDQLFTRKGIRSDMTRLFKTYCIPYADVRLESVWTFVLWRFEAP